jgi:hypothetical protein
VPTKHAGAIDAQWLMASSSTSDIRSGSFTDDDVGRLRLTDFDFRKPSVKTKSIWRRSAKPFRLLPSCKVEKTNRNKSLILIPRIYFRQDQPRSLSVVTGIESEPAESKRRLITNDQQTAVSIVECR